MSFYKVNGSAGHGKTTKLVKDIQSLYNPNSNTQSFIVITPTNKAAAVLNTRLQAIGLPNLAATIHSTIYTWRKTDQIKSIKKVPVFNPFIMKFEKDENGKTLHKDEIEYVWEKAINPDINGKTIFVDESSMVGSEVWKALLSLSSDTTIIAYGDEKQLPPIEKYIDLEDSLKPYYRFWHNFQEIESLTTLTVNYRQHGDLKEFVETIESSVFDPRAKYSIPTPLIKGNNYALPITSFEDNEIAMLIYDADMIITPYNKVRSIVNHICRKKLGQIQNVKVTDFPLVGDRIIFTSSIKEELGRGKNRYKKVLIAKNTIANVDRVVDYSLEDNIVVLDVTDELGFEYKGLMLSLNVINQKGNVLKLPTFNYAYAVTVHSSQGAQWPNVLYLDSFWPGEEASKLRYVAVTRASKEIRVITGVSNKTESADAQTNPLVRIGLQ